MKLKDNLKKRDESTASLDGTNEHIETDCILLADEELDAVAGGVGNNESLIDRSQFIEKTVIFIDNPYDQNKILVLRTAPNGAAIPNAFWNLGDSILIHSKDSTKVDGWYYAYHEPTGKFGYVHPRNVS